MEDEHDISLPGGGQKNLEILGVEELREYIQTLQSEIERVKQVIDKKEGHKKYAESLFRKP